MKNQSTFELFELLLTVSGIGAKSALAIVSKISATDFATAIARQDIKTLMRLLPMHKNIFAHNKHKTKTLRLLISILPDL